MPVVESDMPLFFKLCSDHISVEAIPRKAIRVNISQMKDNPPIGHEVVMWTPHFVILRNRLGQQITLRKDGRMVVRKAESENAAKDAAVQVMASVLENSSL